MCAHSFSAAGVGQAVAARYDRDAVTRSTERFGFWPLLTVRQVGSFRVLIAALAERGGVLSKAQRLPRSERQGQDGR